MTLIRIYPKTKIKSNVSEVKIKISPKKYNTPRVNELYNMRVYFSTTLLNELLWSKENSIAVFKDEKDTKNYVFKLADDNKGFKINRVKDINYIQFTIDSIIDKYKEVNNVNFEITDGGIKIIL